MDVRPLIHQPAHSMIGGWAGGDGPLGLPALGASPWTPVRRAARGRQAD
ncbi:hypothetical protein [Streptomyces avermitilis]